MKGHENYDQGQYYYTKGSKDPTCQATKFDTQKQESHTQDTQGNDNNTPSGMGESDATNFCNCGKKQHKDKILLDQCRLFTALLGPRWGYKVNSPRVGKQERSFQVWGL